MHRHDPHCLLVGFSHFTTAAPNDCRTAIAFPPRFT